MTVRTDRPTSSVDVHVLEGLLVAVGKSDVTAFADFYDAIAPRVYGLAARVIDHAGQAEDVAREVFVEVWRTAARFDPALSSALAWTMAITHRRAVAGLRSGNADAPRPDAAGRSTRPPAGWQTLSAGQRESLGLAYFSGRTHAEVSRLTRSPVNTSATRLTESLNRLRGAIAAPSIEPA